MCIHALHVHEKTTIYISMHFSVYLECTGANASYYKNKNCQDRGTMLSTLQKKLQWSSDDLTSIIGA